MRINPAFLFAALAMAAAGCNPGKTGTDATGPSGDGQTGSHLAALKTVDTVVGKGDPVETGDDVWVRYTGSLMNGKVFDTNVKKDADPFHVTVGSGQVIKGWEQGLLGMKPGGKRKLLIPASLAYGSKSQEKIPANSDLTFDVELVDMLKKKDAATIFGKDIQTGTGKEAKKGDTVTIDYDASTYGGTFENKSNVTFKIGAGEMQVPGFDDAIVGMKAGGKRELKVPPMYTRMLPFEKIGMVMSTWTVTLKAVQ